MRSILLTITLLLSFTASFAQRVQIMSYNIHHGNPPGKDGVIDLEQIAKVINDSGAELVGLQEVDVRVPRSQGIDQALELAELTGMYYFFSKGIDLDGGEYGTLILSKYKIIGNRRYELPMPVPSEQRSLAIVDVLLPSGQVLSFANTHLDLKAENKLAQAAHITEVGDWYDRPLILVGDFNTEPGSEPMNVLETYFSRNTTANAATHPNQNPTTEIDYIMVGKHGNFSWKSYKTIATDASDHLPVCAEVEFK
ncbi:endonuclease/exonuclease/phosphatase family protein [Sphingobacterium paludis]|jgi:endonuclease/exonuclease/phosphatase family metal-dependent hydrolase|uniref:Endonuclease/exonuclease/phosphatase family metal-dependent hydrolase n=1 Tax=Sphingobacterium paludis TaxID=1476465 RepID=A0A4R7CZ88_9SPHI|nr:endonuclease/exonuclease/phosphatase family protein [Sphingobacterium paludis]TDS13933.1 endonuclease/exonuclease/phosphatase family metal-dependent hydrolase [Sphingobacterium paludis]